MLEELVVKTRSYRSFDPARPITREDMLALIDLARRAASAINRQPLRYRVVSDAAECALMLANTRYAGALSIKLPPEGMAPTGYIVICADKEAVSDLHWAYKDLGIAAQTVMLAATERGFGGCMVGSFNAERLQSDLALDARYTPMLVLALGTPAEEVHLVEATDPARLTYYRDEHNVHYVPKLKLEDVLL
jgi:nitroreductase